MTPSQKAAMQQAIDALEWTPCRKLPVIVHVREQRSGEQYVSTREGITPVKPDDLIMRGVSGEEYPIGRAIFQQTYTLDLSQPVNEPVAEVKVKMTGGNIGVATVIHEIRDPVREPLPVGAKLYTSPPPPVPLEPMRKHVEDFAAKGGWTKDSGEGAFEFIQRISYAQGVEDGHNRPAQTPRKLNTVAWLYTLKYGEEVNHTIVSLHRQRYPFGRAGVDYAESNSDGPSSVEETPLYTKQELNRETLGYLAD